MNIYIYIKIWKNLMEWNTYRMGMHMNMNRRETSKLGIDHTRLTNA